MKSEVVSHRILSSLTYQAYQASLWASLWATWFPKQLIYWNLHSWNPSFMTRISFMSIICCAWDSSLSYIACIASKQSLSTIRIRMSRRTKSCSPLKITRNSTSREVLKHWFNFYTTSWFKLNSIQNRYIKGIAKEINKS